MAIAPNILPGNFDAIIIGGSWGAMDAVIRIIKDLPRLYPLPVIVVIHRQRNVESGLCELIGKNTKLKVKEITDKEQIFGGTVYLVPSNYHVFIEKEKIFSLDVSEHVRYSRPSIDLLFESAALVYKNRLLAILLTGANEDGSEGLKTISDKGGVTIVQDPIEALCKIMPQSAINKFEVDFILKLEEINKFLITIV